MCECICHPLLVDPCVFCCVHAHCVEIELCAVLGRRRPYRRTLKRSGSCYPPTPPPPEHSLHHLLFSFNKTPLHFPITSKTISSSFIFFSSIPPSPSYLIVPPAPSSLSCGKCCYTSCIRQFTLPIYHFITKLLKQHLPSPSSFLSSFFLCCFFCS